MGAGSLFLVLVLVLDFQGEHEDEWNAERYPPPS
jgi:hypothetical protein